MAHAVLEAGSEGAPFAQHFNNEQAPSILTLSAPQEKRITDVASALTQWLPGAGQKWPLQTIAATLASRRAQHDFRAAVVVTSHEQATREIEKLISGELSTNAATARVLSKTDRKEIVWLFSGHGSQWPQMGQELLAKDTAFRRTVENLNELILQEAGFSPIDALTSGDFSSSDKVQVLTYVMQVALVSALEAQGVRPGAIIGHSVGEIAAAVAAGALSPIEGALVVCRRARLYQQVLGKGAMILVNQPFDQIAAELRGSTETVAAIDSSPTSCVVSGTVAAIDQLEAVIQARGIKTFRVKSDIAFHSPLLEPLAKPLRVALRDVLHSRRPHSKCQLYVLTASSD